MNPLLIGAAVIGAILVLAHKKEGASEPPKPGTTGPGGVPVVTLPEIVITAADVHIDLPKVNAELRNRGLPELSLTPLDKGMTQKQWKDFAEVLVEEEVPANLEEVAAQLEAQGHVNSGKALRTKARILKANPFT